MSSGNDISPLKYYMKYKALTKGASQSGMSKLVES
jgi:hypothetical protein